MKMQSGLRVVLLAIVVTACQLSVSRGSPVFSQRDSGQEYGQLLINNGDMREPQLKRSDDDALSKRAATSKDMRRSDLVLQSLLNLIIGEWDNKDQVKAEKESPSTPAEEHHPFYHVMIARAPIRLFRRPAVPVYFQNEIETPRGTITTAFLMVLYDEQDNVRMHTYAFRNKEKVIDNWQNKRVFRSLRKTDLIDLGENCEQLWEPDQNGGFVIKSTVGTCIAPMDGQRVILDIGNVAKQSSLSLRFNILTTERAPIMVWGTPFMFTRCEEDVPILDRMLKQFLGEWNNRLQVANESEVSPPMPARERHPELTSIVVRATGTKLFTSPEVAIYIQDEMSTPSGKQQIPHLMVLKPLDEGVRLHPYIFKNPNMILDNWQSKKVFESLTMDDLVDIGPDCEQQFETTPTGGFSGNTTMGICQGRMNGQQVIQDIGTNIEPTMILLKYNILLMDRTPFMAWPTPFQLTRSLEGAEFSTSPVQQLLNQLLGRWNNRHQVQKEEEAQPPISPELKHPLFRTTVVKAASSLFGEDQVPVYMQNDMYMEQALQKTGFLMVLVDHDQGVRMHTYAFRTPAQVIDKWDDPETFENLAMSDLIDLQANCEQQWYPQSGGGFFNPNTTGPCHVQMANLQLSLDLSCRVNPSQLQLKYNMFMSDGTPFIFWAEPFEFSRIPDLSYDTVVDTLLQGGDVHYSLDLSSCSLPFAQGGEAWTPYVGASRLAKINGKVDYFQQQIQGSSQMVHFSSVEMAELHIAVDVFYHESEKVEVKLHHGSKTDQQPTTLICDSMTGDRYMESVFSVHKSYNYRQLTVYRELSRAASREKHVKLVIDRPDQGCVSDRPIPPSSYGIGLQTFFRNELDTTISMTSQWLSHGVEGCGDAPSHTQVHSLSVRVNVGGDSLFLRHKIFNIQSNLECMSIEMVCPIIHDAETPGARVYP